MTTAVLGILVVVTLVIYVLRRRARMRTDEADNF
jgi:uncharacterized MnhB-related membrane protein